MTEPVRVETLPTDRYPLTLDYPVVDGRKFDASDEDGRSWDVKGSMVNGIRMTFKFWEDQHETLADADGGYALVWYRAEGRDNCRAVADGSGSGIRDYELDESCRYILSEPLTGGADLRRQYSPIDTSQLNLV